jgi:hydroxyethylthiazole kinase-like uncharacterized protein yjeF
VAFGALKPGLLVDPGAGHAGVVEFVDIGLRPYLPDIPNAQAAQHRDIARMLPHPGAESDKYRRGVLGLLAGSDRFTGAALLAAGGAVHGGAGMIRLVTNAGSAVAVRREWPEIVVTETEAAVPARGDDPPYPPMRARSKIDRTGRAAQSPESRSEADFPGGVGRVQAWAAGPGMGTGPDAAARLRAVLRTSLPALVDADGITLIAEHEGLLPRPAPTLLTPHAGELGRLLGTDPADVATRRVEAAREAARQYGATVLLKGSTTVIAQPGESNPVYVNTTGTPWLATAGTGDVLSGVAGALLAQGLLPPQAGLAAAYLHGLAARIAASGRGRRTRGEAPIGASDVVRALPRAFRALYH